MIKETALTKTHLSLGAKMAAFAGYNMPISYEGVIAEHLAVRNSVGVFDVSHMGEFLISGDNALSLIQKVTTNDASKLEIGQAQYTCMPNLEGGIVDDLLVYKIKPKQYLLVVNASNIEKDWNWIHAQNEWDVELKNISESYSLLAIQGPKAVEAMQSLTSIDLSSIKYYHFEVADFAGFEHVIISATGYTGAGGFEIYCKNEQVQHIWDQVMLAGADFEIKPIGLAARDTLRLEMGFCLYGNDIDDQSSPIEAGLGWITKFSKEFTNSNLFLKQKNEGVSRKLIGFKMQEKAIPRHGYEILNQNGENIGEVTSGTMSPSLNIGIGMGYVSTENSNFGSEILIKIRNKNVKAVVTKFPFLKK
jgi:aminomethyltransferase